jgi:hypothetical protein
VVKYIGTNGQVCLDRGVFFFVERGQAKGHVPKSHDHSLTVSAKANDDQPEPLLLAFHSCVSDLALEDNGKANSCKIQTPIDGVF